MGKNNSDFKDDIAMSFLDRIFFLKVIKVN